MADDGVLHRAYQHARAFLNTLPDRPVGPPVPAQRLTSLTGPLPEMGIDPDEVIDNLVRGAEPGLVASAGPRYFGFVIGGSLPAALAADWLTSAWDQDAVLYVTSPAAAVIEDVAASWVLDLLGLPPTSSVGFVTGAMMANFTALASARHEVLARVGWDVEERGLIGAPPIHVVIGEEAHVTVTRSLGLLGLGRGRVTRVPADEQGRMRADALRETLASREGPTIVCAQAGNVNTGAFDPFAEIADAVQEHGAWLHIDGAFGLWAAASPALRRRVSGAIRADSWAVDAHKWLNVPYDNGIVVVAHPQSHRAATAMTAAYLAQSSGDARDPSDWVPESSRRARGVTVYAALRTLGRRGVADLIDRTCGLAVYMANTLRQTSGIEILNEVVLNQILVRFQPRGAGQADPLTRAVVSRVQQEGTCWTGGTTWHGLAAMRISVSGWSTAREDIARSAAAITAAYTRERESMRGG
jgi:glutamate/tyrosine decarboxylase-like PLP-dependent enzyme